MESTDPGDRRAPTDEPARDEDDLEASVKGIAQGIVGKLKEVAGELLGDEQLEEEGIVDQLGGKLRRARADDDTT
ncbi:MAG: CsbD family protein [Actinobacteria bacterium]|nr:CsbD family protein [Actinomycetota bacterium]